MKEEGLAIDTLGSFDALNSPLPSPLFQNQKQKITIVGTGQVANATAALLVKHNHEVQHEIDLVNISIDLLQDFSGDGSESYEKLKQLKNLQSEKVKLERGIVEISIIGRSENSESYKKLKEIGINIDIKYSFAERVRSIFSAISPKDEDLFYENPDLKLIWKKSNESSKKLDYKEIKSALNNLLAIIQKNGGLINIRPVSDKDIPDANNSVLLAVIRELETNGEKYPFIFDRARCKPVSRIVHIDPKEFATITTNPEEILQKHGPQDHIFVTTKTYDYSPEFFGKLNILKKTIFEPGQQTTVILGQNGIPCWFQFKDKGGEYRYVKSTDDELVRAIGEENLIGSVLNVACTVITNEEGHISYKITTPPEKIDIPVGRWDNREPESLENLRRIFKPSGIDPAVTMEGGITCDVWKKLQFNVIINGLTALLNCGIGDLLENHSLMLQKLASEVDALYRNPQVGDSLGLRPWDKLVKRLQRSVGHTTSMNHDFNEGHEIEIDAIYQRVLDLADALGEKKEIVGRIRQLTDILGKAVKTRNELIKDGIHLDKATQEARERVQGLVENFTESIEFGSRVPSPNIKMTSKEHTKEHDVEQEKSSSRSSSD